MKKTILLILLSSFVTLIITLFLFELKAQKDQLQGDKIEVVNSEILRQTRQLLVNLPKDYDANPDKHYPVLFALDATSHDHDIVNAASVLSAAKVLSDFIIVGIVNENRNVDLTPHYIRKDAESSEMGGGDAFLEFLEKEAIPFIEKNYRTNNYRMISGNSRAGLFAFYSLLENPKLFDAYFCYSPAFWRDEQVIVEKTKAFLTRQNELNEFLYLSLGTAENTKMKDGFDTMVNLLKAKNPAGIRTFHSYTKHANHATNAFYSIPLALKTWDENRGQQPVN